MPVQPDRRVAVIAVHGVADQRPNDSARAIAAQLLNRDPSEYAPFVERTIHLPLRPVAGQGQAMDAAAAVASGARERIFEELEADYALALGVGSPASAFAKPRPVHVDHAFMRSLLRGYRHRTEPTAYRTSRLESTRSSGGVSQDVHVYELHWADLSTLSRDPLRFFASLYQLLLHVCELGRQALFDAFPEFGGDTTWRRLAWCHKWAVRLLTLVIPVLNLVLLVAVLAAAVVRVAAGSLLDADLDLVQDRGLKFVTVGVTVAMAVGVAFSLASRSSDGRGPGWTRIAISSIVAGAALGVMLVSATGRADVVLAFEWWAIAAVLVGWIMGRYERFRPGARVVGWTAYAAVFGAFVAAIVAALRADATKGRAVEHAAVWTMQTLLFPLSVFWMTFVALGLAALVLGSLAIRRQQADARCRAQAAVRTSRLSLAISASAMLLILTIVWSALVAWAVRSLNVFDCMQTTVFPLIQDTLLVSPPETILAWAPPSSPSSHCSADITLPVHHYFTVLLALSTTSGLPITVAIIGFAGLLLVWMALPSIMLESERGEHGEEESEEHGRWLSLGLYALRHVTHAWFAAVFVVLFVFGIGDFVTRRPDVLAWFGWEIWAPLRSFFTWSAGVTIPMINAGGGLVATSAAVIVFALAKMGGSALDVVLDVDNYLRDKPSEAPPRARIAERYGSLLRYIAAYSDERGKPYDKVVIVSHSLGALITVDLLRFLSLESKAGRGDPGLQAFGFGPRPAQARIPIELFTMGNPVRQLLNRFFPHQYRWVCDVPEGCERPASGGMPPVMSTPCAPTAGDIGVASWVNAYSAGDYVGRALWLREWHRRRFLAIPKAPPGRYAVDIVRQGDVAEMCIGVGAHTHYWGSTAPEIADVTDQLIRGDAASLVTATGPLT